MSDASRNISKKTPGFGDRGILLGPIGSQQMCESSIALASTCEEDLKLILVVHCQGGAVDKPQDFYPTLAVVSDLRRCRALVGNRSDEAKHNSVRLPSDRTLPTPEITQSGRSVGEQRIRRSSRHSGHVTKVRTGMGEETAADRG